ncbi:hypothetical protein [Paenibacillus tundrae]|uniref:Uncharacterized protein n=1 Tax=Paenibacillus tundrae TaxID=528187 RepID=A0ABT9WDH0_9BACL|nr:hypothetical protein [Paenibacillus tundrae]MDQ0171170.1 hypothetical protein [Paenibacillus tundrae]
MDRWLGRGIRIVGGVMVVTGVLLFVGAGYMVVQDVQTRQAYIPTERIDEFNRSHVQVNTSSTLHSGGIRLASDPEDSTLVEEFTQVYEHLKSSLNLELYE